jgi:NADPH:quinone reductase-like Zn-dependent oxidoreductase
MAKANSDDLAALAELMETGKVVAVMDRTYSLEQTPEAVRYVGRKHSRGKVVIVVGDDTHIPSDADSIPIRSVHSD